MEAIDRLRSEHETVYRFVEVLNLARKALREGRRPRREFFDEALEFSRDYVDRHHHSKEELQAFVLLAQRLSGRFDSLLGTLRQQHDRGREHMQAISAQLDEYARGEERAATAIADELDEYAAMLAAHAKREDHILFPLAREVLTDDDDRVMLRAFAKEDDRVGPRFEEDHRELVQTMRARILTAR